MRVLVVGSALVLGGCLEIPPASCPEHGDADGDGWECYGEFGDCDDGDATRSPGLIEICDDGIDQDCNGADIGCPGLIDTVTVTGPPSETSVWQVTTLTTQVQLDPEASWVVSSLRHRDDGEQLLYRGPLEERDFGVAIYPVFHRRDADEVVPELQSGGPARVEIDVAWTDATFGSGVTHLAFSPDGRIFRHEEFHAEAYTHTDPEIYFSTFASFDATRFDTLDWTTNPNPPRAIQGLFNGAPFMGDPSEEGWMCMSTNAGRRLAMAWLRIGNARGPRATHAASAPYLAFEYDWDRDASGIVEGDYESVTMFHLDQLAGTASEPCADLDPGVLEAPAPLLFLTGAPGPDDQGNDGFIEREGLYEIDNAGGDDYVEVEIGEGALDAGVTFRVLIDAPDGIIVFRDGMRLFARTHYLIQPNAGSTPGVLVYFPPGVLAHDNVVRFALPGGDP